jgi:hypothetical protein
MRCKGAARNLDLTERPLAQQRGDCNIPQHLPRADEMLIEETSKTTILAAIEVLTNHT